MAKPLKPIFAGDHPELGWLWMLTPEDFDRVQKGYACGTCLEPFETVLTHCPVCHAETAANINMDAPPEWDHGRR